MNKDEILQKSRDENKDEGLLEAKNKGALLGRRFMAGMCLIILLVSYFIEQRLNLGQYVVLAVFNCYLIGQNIEEYRFTKKSGDLRAIIMYSLITIGWFALFVISLVNKNG